MDSTLVITISKTIRVTTSSGGFDLDTLVKVATIAAVCIAIWAVPAAAIRNRRQARVDKVRALVSESVGVLSSVATKRAIEKDPKLDPSKVPDVMPMWFRSFAINFELDTLLDSSNSHDAVLKAEIRLFETKFKGLKDESTSHQEFSDAGERLAVALRVWSNVEMRPRLAYPLFLFDQLRKRFKSSSHHSGHAE